MKKHIIVSLTLSLRVCSLFSQVNLENSDSITLNDENESTSYSNIQKIQHPCLMMLPSSVEEEIENISKRLKLTLKVPTTDNPLLAGSNRAMGRTIVPTTSATSAKAEELELVVKEPTTDSENNGYIDNEFENNIYDESVAKIEQLLLNQQDTTGQNKQSNTLEIEKIWTTARQIATNNKEKCENALIIAKQETASMRAKVGSINYDANNYEINKLTEELVEAKLQTASATLKAIEIRNTDQSHTAKIALTKAKEEERDAYNKLEVFLLKKKTNRIATTATALGGEEQRASRTSDLMWDEELAQPIQSVDIVIAPQEQHQTTRCQEFISTLRGERGRVRQGILITTLGVVGGGVLSAIGIVATVIACQSGACQGIK